MTCNFEVGQKVVCINSDEDFYPASAGLSWRRGLDGLTEGEIYTITALGPHNIIKDVICCTVAEITYREDTGWGYGVDRFRPLQEKKDEYKSKWVNQLVENLKQRNLIDA